jgi:bifunctional non-homologous end joining protein LigD
VSKQPPPEWVQTADLKAKQDDQTIRYLLCQDEATLLYLANLGCIELNPWNSRLGSLDRPDYLLIDLDPEDTPFDRVIETAHAVRRILDGIGAMSRQAPCPLPWRRSCPTQLTSPTLGGRSRPGR